MDEKNKKEEGEQSSENTGEGVQSKADTTLDRLDASNQKLKEETDRREKILQEEKEFYARKQLGGMTEAGQPPVEKVEESNSDYAKRVMANDI